MKALSNDLEFKRGHNLGAVNSINLARITSQVVYYFWAWLRATDRSGAQEVSVTVPSGNFGNILAGYFAKSMGVPIRRLVLAANENNVLDEFFRTGIYRPRAAAQTLATSSPSMDISKASNLERFLFDLLGRDAERMNSAWRELDETGSIDFTSELPRLTGEFGFGSGTSTHADRLATIQGVYEATGDIIDPHTADGVKVARDYVEDGVPMLVMETAKPAKFQETITEAIGVTIPLSDELQQMLEAPQHVVEMAADEKALRDYVSANAVR